jgi:hypothetical protein
VEIRLTEDEFDEWDALAFKLELPVSNVIRLAMNELLGLNPISTVLRKNARRRREKWQADAAKQK